MWRVIFRRAVIKTYRNFFLSVLPKQSALTKKLARIK
jgi:hypothetical protein